MPHPADDLACDCPGCGLTRAAPALLGIAAGLVLTAGWIGRATWGILRDPAARTVAGLPW